MSRVTVHLFRAYDIHTDQFIVSKRMATLEAIARVNGEPIEGTAVAIEVSDLDPGISGMTPRGYEPRSEPLGFQSFVSR
jgi:hypothetical protein